VLDPLSALRASLREQLAALRGVSVGELPPALLDIRLQRFGESVIVRPREWEQLRHEEGGAGRPVPYWAMPWPSGRVLAETVSAAASLSGARVLELGCGLGLPSIAAARAGADVLATDGASDAVAFAAHSLALNEVTGEVALVDWEAKGEALAAREPWDVVLAADVFYLQANVRVGLRLLPDLLAPGGELWLADPLRAGTRDFLAAARAAFAIATTEYGAVAVHRLTSRSRTAAVPEQAGAHLPDTT
jgi:predicted nicotinamide N-methyase